MVRIRLRRVGARNQPSYRIVAADKESPRDGRFLEVLGHYNPRTEPSTVAINEERLFHWLKHGAQPSDAVFKALRPVGTWDRWERFKEGEKLEVLLAEAESAIPDVDPRTRRDDLFGKRRSKKKPRKKAKAPVEAKPEVEAAPEAEDPDAVVADEEPEAAAAEVELEAAGAEEEHAEETELEATAEVSDEAPSEAEAEEADEAESEAGGESSEEDEVEE